MGLHQSFRFNHASTDEVREFLQGLVEVAASARGLARTIEGPRFLVLRGRYVTEPGQPVFRSDRLQSLHCRYPSRDRCEPRAGTN